MSENKGKKIPVAAFSGTLEIGNSELPCYVLDDGTRVFSTTGMLVSLGFKSNVNAREVLTARAIKPYSDRGKDARGLKLIEFDAGGYGKAIGYDVEQFMDVCQAFSKAQDAGVKLTPRQLTASKRANMLLRATSKVGIIALVDEATGYQHVRQEQELQFKLKLFLAEEMRGWEKTFPDKLWIELARLTDWHGEPTKNRPRYWGYLVMELIYRYLDPDVAEYLKDNKPKPRKGQNYHQWFTEDYGVRKLVEHINQVIGMAQACDTIDELKKKMKHVYGKEPLQLEMFIDDHDKRELPTKIDMPFDEAMAKIAKAGK